MRQLVWIGGAILLMACGDEFQPDGGGGAGGTTSSSSTSSTSGMGGFEGCSSDAECIPGVEWCESGLCVPCDKSGETCGITCLQGWEMYTRNGCTPCDCAPPNQCTSDDQCPTATAGPAQCYRGNHCWDWCPSDELGCCYGNTCNQPGCSEPVPVGCLTTGCPLGQTCVTTTCAPSNCHCDGTSWNCDGSCDGGVCVVL